MRVLDIIERSMRLLGVKASGQSLDATESADALSVLNMMLESWENERVFTFGISQSTHTITANDGTYTIGASGADWIVARPVKLEGVTVNDGTLDLSVELVTEGYWQDITLKTTGGTYPRYAYYDAAYPVATIKFWPVPSIALTATLSQWRQITSFANTAETVSLPKGYAQALAYGLAYELAPEYDKDPRTFEKQMRESRAAIERTNTRSEKAVFDSAIVQRKGSGFQIARGW